MEKNNSLIAVILILSIISQIVSYVAVDHILGKVLTEKTVVVTISENASEPPVETREIGQITVENVDVVEVPIEEVEAENEAPADYETIRGAFATEGVLNRAAGVNYYNGFKETYYNLDMSGVIFLMRNLGYSEEDYPFWIREDGAKMFGDYVMVAANLTLYPKGTVLECSLGKAIVCDTGTFAFANPNQLDVAVNW